MTTEDNHNVPNTQPLTFNTTSHLIQVQRMQQIAASSANPMAASTWQQTTLQMNQEYFVNNSGGRPTTGYLQNHQLLSTTTEGGEALNLHYQS